MYIPFVQSACTCIYIVHVHTHSLGMDCFKEIRSFLSKVQVHHIVNTTEQEKKQHKMCDKHHLHKAMQIGEAGGKDNKNQWKHIFTP